MGAEVNAGTGKETTSVYSRFLDNHLERAFDVLQDMVLRPAYLDIDSERQVVIEEIAMYEDEPQDKVHDVLAGAIFGDHPLGRPIIGRRRRRRRPCRCRRSPRGTTAATWLANMVLGAAGNLEHERIVELAERAFGSTAGAPHGPVDTPAVDGQVLRFHQKETEQYHLCLGGAGHPARRRSPLRAAGCSTRSSAARRRRACSRRCARSAGWPTPSTRTRATTPTPARSRVYVGTRPDNVGKAVEVIGSELRRLHDEGVTEDELERARDNVKGRTVLSMESTLTRMNRLGSSVLMGVPLLTVDELLAAFDAVTLDDVNTLARELWQPERMSAAGVGGDESAFRRALEAVSPALAAA